jgi:hypothetical protein
LKEDLVMLSGCCGRWRPCERYRPAQKWSMHILSVAKRLSDRDAHQPGTIEMKFSSISKMIYL